ncbi:hypothetical protein KMW28_10870 [Flammeovirga yaeyamensis]|uniref:PAS domain-containing protein n=1 Tax=Flammeovirga yaeyamensis TaxID=367791 RepID=A0AAX1N2S8_9BACT|nr:hypothetical protein [Flammeovirga yaeyamensis]MBB3696342.1 PAS domain-containing protein [Flammeovirga yaeyamensis]NMF35021.1 hypothetical protein [Flammeovirga yaeyamensis]QWG00153.1 hypothetical protein KMW28_10870 [Flammeovirga yaeyamensis]
MNAQLNAIFSKLQVRGAVLYIIFILAILSGSLVKMYIDVQAEKQFLYNALSNSQALFQYRISSKEIKKSVEEIRTSGLDLFKFTNADVYFLNDKGSPIFWINNNAESHIFEKNAHHDIPNFLSNKFKKTRYKNLENYKEFFITRVEVDNQSQRSIALVVQRADLWLNQSINTLPITLLSIVLISILYLTIGSSNKKWIYNPLDILIKHLEYESQGIGSELSRDVPAEWHNIFLELEMSKDGKNSQLQQKETEAEITQRFHAQLEELRWAKSQLEKYQNQGTAPLPSNTFLTDVFESSNIGVILTDEDNIPKFVNNKAKEILGKGIQPKSEEDLLDIRKIFIEGTDVEIPSDQHPMVLAKQSNTPQIAKALEVYNPDTGARQSVCICAVNLGDGVVCFVV